MYSGPELVGFDPFSPEDLKMDDVKVKGDV